MSSNINYKPLFIEKVEEFLEKCPEYTLGEFLYCMLTQLSKSGTPIDKRRDALKVTDKDLYASICKAIKEESGGDEPIESVQ